MFSLYKTGAQLLGCYHKGVTSIADQQKGNPLSKNQGKLIPWKRKAGINARELYKISN